ALAAALPEDGRRDVTQAAIARDAAAELHDADGSAAGAGHPPVHPPGQRGRLAGRVLQERGRAFGGRRGGQRAVAEAVAPNGGERVWSAGRGVGVTAFGLAG